MSVLPAPSRPVGERAGRLAAWGCAWLAGAVGLDDLLAAVQIGDHHHRVGDPDTGLALALGGWRAGTARVQVVLPAPGDVLGLPVGTALAAAALRAGEAVRLDGPDGTAHCGWVPEVTLHGSAADGQVSSVHWRAYPVGGADQTLTGRLPAWREPAPAEPATASLADCDAELSEALEDAVRALSRLGLAATTARTAPGLTRLREQAASGIAVAELPPGVPPRAVRLLQRAEQVSGALGLAALDHGASISGTQAEARRAALHPLAAAVRRARTAAYNSWPRQQATLPRGLSTVEVAADRR